MNTTKKERPNILLITTDQQRYDTIAAMGYDFMQTPNLDVLAAEGCCYPNAYSSNPVCMAARHNIITGLTARYHGFDDNYFEESPKVIPYDIPTFPQRSLIDEEHHGSSWVAKRSIKYLKENAGKRPFFLWSSFIEPHPPFDVPEEWADLYKGKELPPVRVSETPLSKLAELKKCVADYPDEAYLQRARELYFASISFVDYNIGKIIQALKESGEYDNTLILFTSDHGEMLGDYGTYQKMLPYDGSARIPFIARYPKKLAEGSKDERFVDLNDLLPTFLDIAGVSYPNPEILPGESIFTENGVKDRTVQYVEHGHGSKRWASLRNERYKYNYYYGGGKEELFDMTEDPDETKNLLYTSELQTAEVLKAKESLREKLIRYEERYGLTGCVKDGDFAVFEEPADFFYRENNPPMFPKKQNRQYVSLEEEVRRAVENEPVVKVEELDVAYFTERHTLDDKALFE